MFILKKIISTFLFPLPLSLLISFTGLYLLWFTSKQKAGKIVVSVGLVILILCSYSFIPNKLLRPLERQYDSFETETPSATLKAEENPTIEFVVVLGGGNTTDPELPITSQIGGGSLVRLVEGIRIYRKHPESKLLLSGGRTSGPVSEAETMASVARALGVPEEDMVLESQSKDTKDEARFIKPIIGNRPFVLVTSASHMPRSMAMFKKLGMNPIPSPTGHIIKRRQALGPRSFFPSAGNLGKTERAIYEYLGLTWAKLKGQI